MLFRICLFLVCFWLCSKTVRISHRILNTCSTKTGVLSLLLEQPLREKGCGKTELEISNGTCPIVFSISPTLSLSLSLSLDNIYIYIYHYISISPTLSLSLLYIYIYIHIHIPYDVILRRGLICLCVWNYIMSFKSSFSISIIESHIYIYIHIYIYMSRIAYVYVSRIVYDFYVPSKW